LAAAADAALPIPSEDRDALIEVLHRLAADPVLCLELGERGREFAATYLREAQVERLEAVLLGAT
jgi:hypothetical protein